MRIVCIIVFVSAFQTGLNGLALPTGDANSEPAKSSKNKQDLEKTPKSLFLIKKIKICPAVGEPQFDPAEAQLRTIIDDAALQNTKKFE